MGKEQPNVLRMAHAEHRVKLARERILTALAFTAAVVMMGGLVWVSVTVMTELQDNGLRGVLTELWCGEKGCGDEQ